MRPFRPLMGQAHQKEEEKERGGVKKAAAFFADTTCTETFIGKDGERVCHGCVIVLVIGTCSSRTSLASPL